jgi:hypothetical protein
MFWKIYIEKMDLNHSSSMVKGIFSISNKYFRYKNLQYS